MCFTDKLCRFLGSRRWNNKGCDLDFKQNGNKKIKSQASAWKIGANPQLPFAIAVRSR